MSAVTKGTDLEGLMESRRGDMHISVTTASEQVAVNAWDELQIDQTDLNTEFAAIPGQIAYWNAVAARFRVVVEATKRDYDSWYGPKYEEAFTALHGATGKKPNINSAENQVRIKHADEYNSRRSALDQAEADLTIVDGMAAALEAKLQALMQIAKRQLVEYDRVEPSVKAPGAQSFSSPPFSRPHQKTHTRQEANTEASRDVFRRMRTQGGSSK